jgi:hypothetical protein
MPCLCEDYGGICRCFERQKWPSYAPLWGDEYAEAELAYFRSESPEAKEARLAADAAADAARDAAAEAYKMATYAEIQGIKNLRPTGKGRERAIGKQDKPCRWLYCNEAAPKSQWTKNAKGELCAPVMKALTGSQCWAHEYLDPKTKAMKKPHTCKHLHPGEDGWRSQWETDRCCPVGTSAAEGFFAQRMAFSPVSQRVQTPPMGQKPMRPSAW